MQDIVNSLRRHRAKPIPYLTSNQLSISVPMLSDDSQGCQPGSRHTQPCIAQSINVFVGSHTLILTLKLELFQ